MRIINSKSNFLHGEFNYSLYNGITNTYFGMLSYIMLNLITNKPIRPDVIKTPKEPKKPSKRISARQVQDNLDKFIKKQTKFNKRITLTVQQVQNNLDAFIKEQRQVNKVLLEFVAEQREFNKKIMARLDNLVIKNNLVE